MLKRKVKEFAEKYEICDAHAHIFPEKIATKAVTAIGNFYGIDMDGKGSADALKESGNKIGVSRYLVCSTATVPHQVESINQFIAKVCASAPEFVGLGSLHPEYEDAIGQVKFCKDNGLYGLKLHPDFQKFNIDDKKAYPIYEAAQSLNMPILFHTGDKRYTYSAPKRLKKIVNDFPQLKVIAAHFGGYSEWDNALDVLKGEENVYFDTCSSLMFISPRKARSLISKYGTEKMFFGTDFPMWKHDEELERFMHIKLTDEQNRKILSENFKEFFHIK